MIVGRTDGIDLCRGVTMAIVARVRSRGGGVRTTNRYQIAICGRFHGHDI
jgi:hypothetical protein